MSSSDRYKQEIMNDLAGGNVESLDNTPVNVDNYDNFDDFAQRSSREERHGLFSRAFHHDNVSPQQMEPELQQAIAQIKPNERDDVAREFFKHLKERGLSEKDLERQLGLSTSHASRMNADDVSKLANFTYHSHPDVFQDVMADQPALLKFLSNPLVGAALGVVAAKWLRKR
jgi:AraC-like DNA-binding protein